MRAFRETLNARASNWAVLVLSGSMLALAVSVWTRPTQVSAQATAPARKAMTGESKVVLDALQDAFVHIADTVEPSVVTISASSNAAERPSGPPMPMADEEGIPEPFRDLFKRFPRGGGGEGGPDRGAARSTGSGVIIREEGSTVWVLTNNHVVEERNKFRVQLFDKTENTAELVGVDPRTDLAVLKFKTRKALPAGSVASLGNSDAVKVGQWAIAIGSPLGYESTLTVGVISAKGRELDGPGGRGTANYVDLLQTDASINPGNSGGPLVNVDGEVVGVNVAIASSGMSQGNIGIGFAIPANTAKMVAEQLMSKGKVVRGFLGVAVSPNNRELAPELREHLKAPEGGALAETVSADTPAGRAGMKDGDVIVKFGDRQVTSFTDLEKAVAATKPGSSVPVEVIRDGKPVRLNVTVIERPADSTVAVPRTPRGPAPERQPVQPTKSKYGLTIRPSENNQGAEIVSVSPGSPAFEAGLDAGYVIEQVGTTPTPSVDSFQKAINAAPADTGVVLKVKTPNGLRLVVVRP